MSGADDGFLTRWSRRKQAVKAAEESTPARAAVPEQAATPQLEAPLEAEMPVGEEAAERAEPLPSLEDLTAESDVTAFLRKGVPDGLRNAALRKMWALDPAIRDHVGPAEYAWDFNNPASIPGFGGATASAAMEKLAALSGAGESSPPDPADLPAAPVAGPETPSGERVAAQRLGEGSSNMALGNDDPSPSPSPPNSGVPELGNKESKSETSDFERGGGSAEAWAPEEPPRPAPRHGSAVPR